jgi:hypothetical protein
VDIIANLNADMIAYRAPNAVAQLDFATRSTSPVLTRTLTNVRYERGRARSEESGRGLWRVHGHGIISRTRKREKKDKEGGRGKEKGKNNIKVDNKNICTFIGSRKHHSMLHGLG